MHSRRSWENPELLEYPRSLVFDVDVHINTLFGLNYSVTYPVQAAMIATEYAPTSFSSIHTFPLSIQWLVPRDVEDLP